MIGDYWTDSFRRSLINHQKSEKQPPLPYAKASPMKTKLNYLGAIGLLFNATKTNPQIERRGRFSSTVAGM